MKQLIYDTVSTNEYGPKSQQSNQIDPSLLDILEVLKTIDGAGITEIAEQTDTTKSTVHNHLSTPVSEDMW